MMGATQVCADASVCWQLVGNLKPRHGYTFRPNVDGHYQDTPKKMLLTWRANGPGDWILMAIPYPTSAQPFTITLDDVAIKQASSMATLDRNSYFYNASSQHLYVMLVNEDNGINPKNRYVRDSIKISDRYRDL